MQAITSKQKIREILAGITIHEPRDLADSVVSQLLSHKIKFPLLEFAATELYPKLNPENRPRFLENILRSKAPGSYVIAGIFLQKNLPGDLKSTVDLACTYITEGNEWHVCDIIGERVMGYALLHFPEEMLPVLLQLAQSKNSWVVRSVGVASHYATKKKLPLHYVRQVFSILLSQSGITEFHAKTGIGWGAKTCIKFHPVLNQEFYSEIYDDPSVRQWFRTKVKIGLSRSEKYAQRN